MPKTDNVVEASGIFVAPWEIEADHPRNCQLGIQSVPGLVLRSAIDGSKTVVDAKSGEIGVPVDQSVALASFPRTPGQRLRVDPENSTYTVTDPLTETQLTSIHRYLKTKTSMSTEDKLSAVPTVEGKLEVHQMKTLCREMYQLVKSKEAKRSSGPMPSLQEIDDSPGDYLLNPGARIRTSQPRYEKDLPKWIANLDRVGG